MTGQPGYGEQSPEQMPAGQPVEQQQPPDVTADPVTIETNRAALRAAFLTATERAGTAAGTSDTDFASIKEAFESVLLAAQALAAIDPSLHPQKQAQGPGSREGAPQERAK